MPLTGEAKRDYQRRWLAARRAEFFDGKTCEWCGSTERLELHHVDQNKKVDPWARDLAQEALDAARRGAT